MKVVVLLDGERREVDVDLARPAIRIGPHEWPIQVDASADGTVSFQILGERIEVRGGPAPGGKSSDAVTINGELHSLVVESSTGSVTRSAVSAPSVVASSPDPALDSGPGQAIRPPMPGKVLEVRVRDGDHVEAGQVLLVVEAMKMRNDVTSPIAGAVTGLGVAAGANVGARDVLLRILPG